MEKSLYKGRGIIYMTTATVRKWGNSLAVRIPQDVSELVKFADGVEIEMFVTEEKELVLRQTNPIDEYNLDECRRMFEELRAQCKPGKERHEEVFAEPVGNEVW
jgi:antitoxin component of MazEF toxin-antitoxin module